MCKVCSTSKSIKLLKEHELFISVAILDKWERFGDSEARQFAESKLSGFNHVSEKH